MPGTSKVPATNIDCEYDKCMVELISVHIPPLEQLTIAAIRDIHTTAGAFINTRGTTASEYGQIDDIQTAAHPLRGTTKAPAQNSATVNTFVHDKNINTNQT